MDRMNEAVSETFKHNKRKQASCLDGGG